MARDNLVGLTRHLRRSPEEAQIAELEAHGCTRIWSWDERGKLLRYIGRNGDRVVVTEAHCLGSSRNEAASLFVKILDRRATIEVLRPALTSETPKGAALIAFAVTAGLAGDSKALTTEDAREYGRRTGHKKRERRTALATMKRYWNSAEAQALNVHERMQHPAMRGWKIGTVYRWLKKPPQT